VALEHDAAWVAARAAEAVAARDRFTAALIACGVRVLPSRANFVLLPVRDARASAAALAARGVRVRPFPALEGIGDALRVTVAPWPVLESTLDAFAEVLR
jgi:histidinol-phosphate/aromatic aminotransferase/cobyric acid decarboxylase-like protein